MIDVSETFRLSFSELKRNKSRSLLTMLGIIIGVFAVITLVSVGSGLKNYIVVQFESLGTNVLYIMPGQVGGDSESLSTGHGPPNFSGSKLKPALAVEIKKLGEPIVEAVGDIEVPVNAKYKNKQKRVTVIGSTEQIFPLISLQTDLGRLFNNADVSSSRRVAVIGPEVEKKLYGDSDSVGKEIILSGTRFTVIGVLASKGAGIAGGQFDSSVYIPMTVAKSVFGVENYQTIMVKFSDKERLEETKFKVKNLLLKTLKEDDFSVINQSSILSTISSILSVITIALGGIAAISLLVGGIGIMNIMLVSVTERTREIGIRKSVGATNSDILSQFLIEAVFLSVVGGAIGMILGIFGAIIIGKLISANALTWWSIILALGVSSTIGIVFGVAPAAKAAKLDPVEALRYE